MIIEDAFVEMWGWFERNLFSNCEFNYSLVLPLYFSEPFSKSRLPGRIIFFSGKSGLVIKSVSVPDNHESYFSPVVYLNKNGTQMVVFGTGGETHAGSLYVVELKDLLEADLKNAKKLLTNSKKGKKFL